MENGKFQPSLLKGLYKTDSVPVTWDEVYRIITQNEVVKQQTALFRQTRNEQVKHALPCITPAVQLNGTGKTVEDVVGLTGFTMCDIDHVPEERIEEMRRLIEQDPHTVLVHLTVSGQGFHIIARYAEGMDYDTAFLLCNAYYADLVEHDYDDQCMNLNRTFSLCHDPLAYYNPCNRELIDIGNRELNNISNNELNNISNNELRELHELSINPQENEICLIPEKVNTKV